MPEMSVAAVRRRWGSAAHRFRHLPRWARAGLALVAILLGIYLISRPTMSLAIMAIVVGAGFLVQGVLVLAVDEERPPEGAWWRRSRALDGGLWITAGLFILLFLGLTVRLLAVVVAVALMATGARQLIGSYRRTQSLDHRIADAAFGIATIAFGLLALLWPDITLIIAAVVFGARLIMSGATELWRAVRGGTVVPRPRRLRAPRGPLRILGALCTVLVVVLAAAVSLAVRSETPVVDQFYAAPREVPHEPGKLIRAAPFTRDVPADAVGWRILYTTRRGDGASAVASAIVVVPRVGPGDWPVINWDHGTTGYAQICAPSLLPHPFDVGALFVLPQIIERGWALVATDYIGLGTVGPHPYLVGKDSAYATLDALRAAKTLHAARLGDESVVWGHSQGGAAALWTGALAKKYAPELKIEGVAALAPAANLPGLTGSLNQFIGGSVFASFVAAAYSATYSDVTWSEYIRPGAEPVVRAMSERCLTGAGLYVSVLDALSLTRDPDIFGESPTIGPLGRRLEENVPPATITVPLLIAQGDTDPIVLPAVQKSYIARVRSAGEHVDYRTFAGEDHVGLVKPGSPLIPVLFSWTASRFATPVL
ncbi:hypothetical protein LK09_09120 [Microbacterium mangrovi]|uniref:Lipase n=1 Tax=Microbacterium mangrovi TaxID=1348253 RepID=A0A0B2A4K9_9MICO|nr:lipase family protein [Microbacterium mangrovi]KHK97990.1 hypothetical protein LK09_09120 [Microbacterium mangrovi]